MAAATATAAFYEARVPSHEDSSESHQAHEQQAHPLHSKTRMAPWEGANCKISQQQQQNGRFGGSKVFYDVRSADEFLKSLLDLCEQIVPIDLAFCTAAAAEQDDLDMAFKLLDRGLHRAIKKFKLAASQGAEAGPYIVAVNVSEETFQQWVQKKESCWKLAWFSGTVFFYGDPSIVHERVKEKVCELIHYQLYKLQDAETMVLGEDAEPLLESLGSTAVEIDAGSFKIVKEPDACWVPRGMSFSFPTLVMEIAYMNESFELLKRELNWWLLGGAMYALGIKVDVKDVDSTLKCTLVCVLLEKGKPDRIWRFSDLSSGEECEVPLSLKTLLRGIHHDTGFCESFVHDTYIKLNLTKVKPMIEKLVTKSFYKDNIKSFFCTCKDDQMDMEDMVVCSNQGCDRVIFHKFCMGLPSEGIYTQWLCPYCREQPPV